MGRDMFQDYAKCHSQIRDFGLPHRRGPTWRICKVWSVACSPLDQRWSVNRIIAVHATMPHFCNNRLEPPSVQATLSYTLSPFCRETYLVHLHLKRGLGEFYTHRCVYRPFLCTHSNTTTYPGEDKRNVSRRPVLTIRCFQFSFLTAPFANLKIEQKKMKMMSFAQKSTRRDMDRSKYWCTVELSCLNFFRGKFSHFIITYEIVSWLHRLFYVLCVKALSSLSLLT